MNSLKIVCLASTLTLTLLGSTQAQTQPTQRIEVTGNAAPTRYGDADEPYTPMTNPRTREEVRAELMAYLAKGGHVYEGGESGPPREPFVSTKTRAEVLAEAAAWRARGAYVREGDEFVLRQPTPLQEATLTAQKRDER